MKRDRPNPFDEMRASLKSGVVAIAVPQLFETPAPLAAQAVALAELAPGMTVLEPSAGTGRLLTALLEAGVAPERVTAVELDAGLCRQLRQRYAIGRIEQGDFLGLAPMLGLFDRVVMNPPFTMGEDVRHIEAARALLAPRGRLVAFCADGPRQRQALRSIADSWESLPSGSFRGTGVRAALLTIGAA